MSSLHLSEGYDCELAKRALDCICNCLNEMNTNTKADLDKDSAARLSAIKQRSSHLVIDNDQVERDSH